VTLSGTDVSSLAVSQVDLSSCKFVHAHNLDKLRVNSDDSFGWTPEGPWFSRRQITGDERRRRHVYGLRASRALAVLAVLALRGRVKR
jgi:hypothetical protein